MSIDSKQIVLEQSTLVQLINTLAVASGSNSTHFRSLEAYECKTCFHFVKSFVNTHISNKVTKLIG